MTLIIKCETAKQSYRWTLRPGECAFIGRSPWVEFSISDDLAIAGEHLRIDYSQYPEWNWLAPPPESVTLSLDEALGTSNQTTFTIGSTQFQITWSHRLLQGNRSVPSDFACTEEEPTCVVKPWNVDHEGLAELGVKADVVRQLVDCTDATMAVMLWRERNQMQDALRLIAWELNNQSRVAWLVHAIPNNWGLADGSKLANIWLEDPSESNRQLALQRMEQLETSAPEYWMLGAIAWTGGSLSTAPSAVIAPPRSLPVLAALTALNLASSQIVEFDLIERAISNGLEMLRSADLSIRNLAEIGGRNASRG